MNNYPFDSPNKAEFIPDDTKRLIPFGRVLERENYPSYGAFQYQKKIRLLTETKTTFNPDGSMFEHEIYHVQLVNVNIRLPLFAIGVYCERN